MEFNLENKEFPLFLQGPYLRAALTMLPFYAEKTIHIMVPYLIQSQILDSILNTPNHVEIKLYTRNRDGYLPNIKIGAQPAMEKLFARENLEMFIDNKIHAKIWKIDDKFAIVHSMNGTPTSEMSNFEAGVISIQEQLIKDVQSYFDLVEQQATRIK